MLSRPGDRDGIGAREAATMDDMADGSLIDANGISGLGLRAALANDPDDVTGF